jgi:hypothetical protein
MPQIFFSRISIATEKKLDTIQKAEFLLSGFDIEKEVSYRKDNYKFVRPEIVKVGGKIYVVGYIVKYKPIHQDFVVNDKNEIEEIDVTNKVLAAIRFIIDPASSIVMHEENKSHIPKESFGDRFTQLFKEVKEVDVIISAITEDYDFLERVSEVKEIKKIQITLVPSNPNNSDLWKDVDDRLNNDQIGWYKEIQVNKKKGQSIKIDEETQKKFFMSEDGYGKSDVTGFDSNGEHIKVTTEDTETHSKMNLNNDIVNVQEQIELLQEKLNELIRRTNEAE